jgi:hypothetical protein
VHNDRPTIEDEAAAIGAEAKGEATPALPQWDPDSCWLLQLLCGSDGAPPNETIH